ncbi:ABC transporter substrate-binding protein [Paenibacillus sacheonensis]|uniref:Extracellular solute-binding protein n=1 Tax=Paenibacillus sacheonensis TaxID=742054 RepID=A0A7X4YMV1_9BACL|nr:ABC transporter substrate-binding protein [Paenibacillus sacheonensis]NBC69290.1 extracellular solute-binding protein [Paenibacillus sacheonensis]
MPKRRIRKLSMVLVFCLMATLLYACGGNNSNNANTTTTNDANSNANTATNNSTTPADTTNDTANNDAAANNGSGNEPAEPAAEWQGEININVSSTNKAGWNAVAAAYTAKNPKVKINVDLKPDGYADWLRAQLTSATPTPDIVNGNVVADLIKTKFLGYNSYLQQLNPYTNNVWIDDFKDFATQSKDITTGDYYNLNLETVQVAWFYNKSIFEKVGVTPPTTWDELVEVSKKIKAAGYIPIALEGDYDSFWSGSVGWLMRIYADSYLRSKFKDVRCQPGDFCYDEEVDGTWQENIADPHNDDDALVNKNPLRQWKAIQDHTLNVTNDDYKEMYTNFKKLIPEYVENGFFGTKKAYPLFLSQKAAMRLDGAWLITSFDKDLTDSEKNGGSKTALPAFEYGVFPMPKMEGPNVDAPVRTIEVPIGFLSVVKKDQAHNDLVMDFMKFYASAPGYSVYLDATLKDGQGISGPPILKGVQVDPKIQEKFDNLTLLGNSEKGNAMGAVSRGVADFQPSVREWVSLAQEYFSGKKTVDQFLEAYQKSLDKNFEGALKSQHLELSDLTTPEKKPPERK